MELLGRRKISVGNLSVLIHFFLANISSLFSHVGGIVLVMCKAITVHTESQSPCVLNHVLDALCHLDGYESDAELL